MNWNRRDYAIVAGTAKRSELRNMALQRTLAWNKVERANQRLADVELILGIEAGQRWTADHPTYRETLDLLQNHKFIHAVDKLERLVVQRLFELTKVNMSNTGK